MNKILKTALALSVMAGGFAAAPAFAADNAMKVCGERYQAAKTAKTLPAGQTWAQYLSGCRASLPKTAAAAPAVAAKPMAAKPAAPVAAASAMAAKPAAAKPARAAAAKPAPRAPGTFTAGQTAAHDRQRACGQQWTAAKAAGKIPAGMKWPQYWSQCNTRMKGG